MEIANDPIIKDMIGTVKSLTTKAYIKGFREGVKTNRLHIANLLNELSEGLKEDPEFIKKT